MNMNTKNNHYSSITIWIFEYFVTTMLQVAWGCGVMSEWLHHNNTHHNSVNNNCDHHNINHDNNNNPAASWLRGALWGSRWLQLCVRRVLLAQLLCVQLSLRLPGGRLILSLCQFLPPSNSPCLQETCHEGELFCPLQQICVEDCQLDNGECCGEETTPASTTRHSCHEFFSKHWIYVYGFG